jgi:hypothetical protein
MKCPSCGYEYFSEDLENCLACGKQLARKTPSTESPEMIFQKRVINELDHIKSGVDFLVIVVILSMLITFVGMLLALVAL